MSESYVIQTENPSVVVHERAVTPTLVTQRNDSTVIVREDRSQVVVREERASVAVAGGNQGPPGVAGQDGASPEETYPAGAIVNGHRALVRLADGRVAHYDADDETHHGTLIGVSLNAAVEDGDVLVRQLGRITFNGWSWTRGLPIFARDDGTLSHSPGTVAVQVAEATSATSIFVRVERPIYLA